MGITQAQSGFDQGERRRGSPQARPRGPYRKDSGMDAASA